MRLAGWPGVVSEIAANLNARLFLTRVYSLQCGVPRLSLPFVSADTPDTTFSLISSSTVHTVSVEKVNHLL